MKRSHTHTDDMLNNISFEPTHWSVKLSPWPYDDFSSYYIVATCYIDCLNVSGVAIYLINSSLTSGAYPPPKWMHQKDRDSLHSPLQSTSILCGWLVGQINSKQKKIKNLSFVTNNNKKSCRHSVLWNSLLIVCANVKTLLIVCANVKTGWMISGG